MTVFIVKTYQICVDGIQVAFTYCLRYLKTVYCCATSTSLCANLPKEIGQDPKNIEKSGDKQIKNQNRIRRTIQQQRMVEFNYLRVFSFVPGISNAQ